METATTLVFRLTARQRLRYRLGVGGVAFIVLALGIVRLTVTGRLASWSDLGAVVALALVLAAAATVVARMEPILVLAEDAAHLRWGPRRGSVPWADVTAVDIRERGTARRVLLHTAEGRTVLPVPLTGGSILGPGADPDLDHKVELISGWWRERRR